jgi:hypothetical protein
MQERKDTPMLDVQIATPEALLRQASITANDYMLDAKARIDAAFGTDYAYEHPELVAAFMRTAAQARHTAMMKVAAQESGMHFKGPQRAPEGATDINHAHPTD